MLQSVIVRYDFSSGKYEYEIMVMMSVPPAQIRSNIIIRRIYFFVYGLLSVSRRKDSHGGQLASKMQHRAVRMKKLQKMAAKIMYGIIIEDMYWPNA